MQSAGERVHQQKADPARGLWGWRADPVVLNLDENPPVVAVPQRHGDAAPVIAREGVLQGVRYRLPDEQAQGYSEVGGQPELVDFDSQLVNVPA